MLRLRQERIQRGWTQTRLAALSDIASTDISALERGRKPAYPGWRRKLANVFGLPEANLFSVADADAEARPTP